MSGAVFILQRILGTGKHTSAAAGLRRCLKQREEEIKQQKLLLFLFGIFRLDEYFSCPTFYI